MRLCAGRWLGESLWERGPVRKKCARMVLGGRECPRLQSSARSLPQGVAATHSDARGSHAGAYREQAGRADAPRPALALPASMCASMRTHNVVRHRAASSSVAAGLDRGFVPKFYLVRRPCSSCQAFLCALPALPQRLWPVSVRKTGPKFSPA